jgi:Uma2 family endonuclease
MAQPSDFDRMQHEAPRARYLEPAHPLVFPESAEVPETQLHLDLRTALYLLLSDYLGDSYTVGSDQFVYWDAGNPQRCLAPDVYAKRSPRGEPVRTWKVWERGAPDLAIEIVSDSDSLPASWSDKLEQYQTLGVEELVRLDLLSDAGPVLRIWNRMEGRLRERAVETDGTASLALPLRWVVAPLGPMSRALRFSDVQDPPVFVPTAHEARQAEAKARQAEAKARQAETKARQAAEARVAELEALLAEREGRSE